MLIHFHYKKYYYNEKICILKKNKSNTHGKVIKCFGNFILFLLNTNFFYKTDLFLSHNMQRNFISHPYLKIFQLFIYYKH